MSVAAELVSAAEAQYEFGVSTGGDAFAVPKEGPRLVAMLRGGRLSLRAQLAATYFAETERVASQSALADALSVIEGKALRTEPVDLHVRVASDHAGTTWLDLGDTTGLAIEITPSGWRLVEPSVMFRRSALTGALPRPTTGGKGLALLWDLLNVAPDDRPLVLGWLIHGLEEHSAHPILAPLGEQGTGKSTATRTIASIIDPSPVPARKVPRDIDAWVTAAAGSWVVGLDNVSAIPEWFSDSLCRAVTGDGDVRRTLYTDGDLSVFAFRRCVILNGIDLGALRGDLADRLLRVELGRILPDRRREDSELGAAWRSAHPAILGALLDLAVEIKSLRPEVELSEKPRMADFARTLAAVDKIMGMAGLQRYLSMVGGLAADVVEGNSFAAAITQRIRAPFVGTAAELLDDLVESDTEWRALRDWPANPRAATGMLRRLAPTLRQLGWTIDDIGKTRLKTRQWRIEPPPGEHVQPAPATPAPPAGQSSDREIPGETDGASDAGRGYKPVCRDSCYPRTEPEHPRRPPAPDQGEQQDRGDRGHRGRDAVAYSGGTRSKSPHGWASRSMG